MPTAKRPKGRTKPARGWQTLEYEGITLQAWFHGGAHIPAVIRLAELPDDLPPAPEEGSLGDWATALEVALGEFCGIPCYIDDLPLPGRNLRIREWGDVSGSPARWNPSPLPAVFEGAE